MKAAPGSAWRLRDTLTSATLFLATAAFTLWQNTRIAALWDLSFLLDTSYRWSLGQLPYKDLPFPHVPIVFLLHASIIRLFGRIYYPHILCAAIEGGIATFLTWRLLIGLLAPLGNLAWRIATVLAAPLIVLGIYGVYPHPIYDSDCILGVLLALYLLQRAAASPARNLLAGAACVLPLFIKQNIGLAFLLVALAAAAAIAIARHRQRLSVTPQLWLFGGAAATLAAAIFAIQTIVGLHNYLHWTIAFAAQRRSPGLALLLNDYRQPWLLWTLPAAAAALVLLSSTKHRPDASSTQPYRNMGATQYRILALILLAAPFLWTVAALALATDPSDRADQLLSLWPHLLLLGAALGLYRLRLASLRASLTISGLLPLVLIATIEGTFLSEQLWGSTYAIWPLLMLLIATLLLEVPSIARPLAVTISATFLLCGGLYAVSHERLSYTRLDPPGAVPIRATLPELRGLATPGPWIPDFEELVRVTNAELPRGDGILLLPGEVPFFFATGRTPQFPVLLFDPATDPYTPEQTVEQARAHNIRWLIVTRNLQLAASPYVELPAILQALKPDFVPYRTLTNYEIYRRK